MKTVAIVGAGPSGLVAAKTLLRSKKGQYDVKIFEKTGEVGGLWAVYKDRPYDGMLNPEMPTNLSRFNIGFSDLSWHSIGLEGHVPYWPKAWQVGQYIRAFAKKYIPPDVISFHTRVTFADSEKSGDHELRWKLRWKSAHGNTDHEQEQIFDHLIIATGLFSASSIPQFTDAESAGIKVIHSSKLRKLQDVVPENVEAGGTIVVAGGGMSGGDASTLLASQISDASHSPNDGGRRFGKLKLVQVCPEAAYALPLAAPVPGEPSPAPDFLPLDLCMYDLGRRPPGPIAVNVGRSPPELIETVHGAFRKMVGDQSDLKTAGLKFDQQIKAPYVTLTEQYSGFVRSGNIEIITGRLSELRPTGVGKSTALVSQKGKTYEIQDVVGVVYATGFTPQLALDFLGPELRKALQHDPTHNRLPIILDEHAALVHDLPGFAVVGYHEGAFWGSMEMESRLVEHEWTRAGTSNGYTNGDKAGRPSQRKALLELRPAMTDKQGDVPQYWLGDYVGLMETISRQIGLQREEFDWPVRSGPITIFRYAEQRDGNTETQQSLAEFLSVLHRSKTEGLFAARATFLALQGHWKIERSISSVLESMPSGQLTGTASFHPRSVTDASYDSEYLYIERGEFRMNNGMTMQATRQYVYRYQESTDQMTVWFVKGDGRTVDYLYHGLKFDVDSRKDGWIARADHLCVADMYQSDYRFSFEGANLKSLRVIHAVKGPKKNYVSETMFSR